jgi:hypothetical protein
VSAPAEDDEPRRWRVRRRWLPWRRQIREVPDVPLLDVGAGLDGTIGAIVALIALVVAIPALVVIALLLFEVVLLLALLPLVVLARLLLPVPWTVETWSRPASRRLGGWRLEGETKVRGWRASAHAIAELRQRHAPPPDPFGA